MSGITHLRSGLKTVAEPGKPVRLEDEKGAAAPVVMLIVEALSTNEGMIVVGGPSVVAAPGTHAAPTRKGIALAAGASLPPIRVNDVGAVWIDAVDAGDGVSWTALAA